MWYIFALPRVSELAPARACRDAHRKRAVLLPALAVVLRQLGLLEEDDGLFAVSHVGDEEFLLGGASLMLRCHRYNKKKKRRNKKQKPTHHFTRTAIDLRKSGWGAVRKHQPKLSWEKGLFFFFMSLLSVYSCQKNDVLNWN